jgi:hypothetical protein
VRVQAEIIVWDKLIDVISEIARGIGFLEAYRTNTQKSLYDTITGRKCQLDFLLWGNETNLGLLSVCAEKDFYSFGSEMMPLAQ